jgi:aminomethyltransferase
MPIPTAFHSRTAPLCQSYDWRNWAGYIAVSVYEPSHEREYYAIRNAAALIDVSPLFKYEVTGPDAARLVDRIITRDVSKCAIGQVMYTPWCDERGKMIDDGTVSRLAENHFRITAADPNLRWFQDCGFGLQATVKNVSAELAALSLQGPNTRKILKEVVKGTGIEGLKFFRLAHGQIDDFPVTITRTGYTGDLGYELWVAPNRAERLWDVLMEKGKGHGIMPVGMVAMDIARVEAGLLLTDIDYVSSHKALIEARKSSPFEVGLEWTVKLDKAADFVGRKALLAEKESGSKWQFVGLEVHWEALEALYTAVGLPPQVAGRASRVAVPIYKNGKQIGQATSSAFSPILKKFIAIGTVESPYARLGAVVDMEITVEFVRHQAPATIVKTPFFDPPRKRQ